jgi:hypothetical protein
VSRSSWVPLMLAVQIGAVFLLLSCASSQPSQQVRVHVTPGFSGTIHLAACVSSAPATDISTGPGGTADTSVCPRTDGIVAIVVVKGDRESTVAPEDISISRTGDGIATSINAQVRP